MKPIQFSIYGLIIGLIALVPFVPIFSMMPGVGIALGIGKLIGECEFGYVITNWLLLFIAATNVILFIKKVDKLLETKKYVFLWFCLWSLPYYFCVNFIALTLVAGIKASCYGDGQIIFYLIYSTPIAAFCQLLFGIIVDIRNYMKRK